MTKRGQQELEVPGETLSSKVAHVKAAVQKRRHACHWPGCKTQVKPALWGCARHWFMLPKELRDKVWGSYSAGQEDRMDPSDEYLAVADEVQAWIAKNHPGSP